MNIEELTLMYFRRIQFCAKSENKISKDPCLLDSQEYLPNFQAPWQVLIKSLSCLSYCQKFIIIHSNFIRHFERNFCKKMGTLYSKSMPFPMECNLPPFFHLGFIHWSVLGIPLKFRGPFMYSSCCFDDKIISPTW